MFEFLIQCTYLMFLIPDQTKHRILLKVVHTLQGDNFLKSVERFDHIFVCRFQASR